MPILRNSSLIACLMGFLMAVASAQAQGEDPAGLFLQAYQQYKVGERMEASGRSEDALAKYRFCASLLEQIQQKHAEYEPVVIDYRLKKSRESIARIESLKHTEPLPELPADEALEGPLPGADGPSYIQEPNRKMPQERLASPGAGFSFSGSYRIPLSGGRAARPQSTPYQSVEVPPALEHGASSGNGAIFARQQEEIRALRSKLRDAEKRASDLSEKLLEGTAREQSALHEVDKTKVALLEVRAQLDQVRQTLGNVEVDNKRLATGKMADQERITALESDLEAARADLEVAEDYNAELFAKLENAAGYIKQSDAIREQLQSERNTLKQKLEDGASEEIKLLTADKESLAKERDEALRQNKELADKLEKTAGVQTQNRALGERLQAAEAKAEELAKVRDALSLEQGRLTSKNEEAQKKLDTLLEEKKDLADRLSAAQEEAQKLGVENPELQQKVQGLEGELAEKEKQLVRERDLAASSVKLMEGEKNALSEKLETVQEQVRTMAGRESGREKLLNELKAQLTSVQAERVGEGNKVKDLEAQNTVLSGKLVNAETQVKTLSTQLPERDHLIADLRTEMETLRSKQAAMREGVDSGQKRIAELEKQLEETSAAAAGASGAMAEENALLKSIVTRELQEQARRQQARKLVDEEVKKLQVRSETLIGKLDALGSAEVELTEKERRLFEKPVMSSSVEGGKNSMNISMVVEKKSPDKEHKSTRENDLPNELIERAAKANALANTGDLEQANGIYEELVAEAPESYFAKVNLGVTQLKLARHAKAIETLEGALEIRPGDAFALMNLGIAQYRFGQYGEAARALEAAVAASPDQYFSHYFLGLALNEGGNTDGAVSELLRAIEIKPDYAQAHLNLAIIYATSQPPDKEKARQHYEQALKLGAPADASLEQLLR